MSVSRRGSWNVFTDGKWRLLLPGCFIFMCVSYLPILSSIFFPPTDDYGVVFMLHGHSTVSVASSDCFTSGYGQNLSSLVSAIKYLGRISLKEQGSIWPCSSWAQSILVGKSPWQEFEPVGCAASTVRKKRKEYACLASFLLFVQSRTQTREWCCLLEGGSSCLKHFRLGVFQPRPSKWPLTDVPRS